MTVCSFVQASAVNAEVQLMEFYCEYLVTHHPLQIANVVGTDTFVEQTPNSGPVVSRLILSDAIDEPLFSVRLHVRTRPSIC